MARLFNDASSEYLYIEQALFPSLPFAVTCRFNVDNLTAARALVISCDKDVDNQAVGMYVSTAGAIKAYSYSAAGYGEATSSSTKALNTWGLATGIFVSSTDRRALLDGANKGTNTTAVTPANLDRTVIGAIRDLTPQAYMSGIIAEVAVYDLSVWPGATDSDKADNFELASISLGKTYTPEFFPLGRVAYWDLRSGIKDRQGAYDLTASGTTLSAHPRIIRPTSVLYGTAEAYTPPASEGGIMTCNTGFWGAI